MKIKNFLASYFYVDRHPGQEERANSASIAMTFSVKYKLGPLTVHVQYNRGNQVQCCHWLHWGRLGIPSPKFNVKCGELDTNSATQKLECNFPACGNFGNYDGWSNCKTENVCGRNRTWRDAKLVHTIREWVRRASYVPTIFLLTSFHFVFIAKKSVKRLLQISTEGGTLEDNSRVSSLR